MATTLYLTRNKIIIEFRIMDVYQKLLSNTSANTIAFQKVRLKFEVYLDCRICAFHKYRHWPNLLFYVIVYLDDKISVVDYGGGITI